MSERHVRVVWRHSYDTEPVEVLAELDDERWEVRRVERYRDGASDWADAGREDETIVLGEAPYPPLEEINEQAEFEAAVITRAEFEAAWRCARGEEPG